MPATVALLILTIPKHKEGELIQPTRGTQYEVGIKADLTSNLSATLAAYEITKTNILREDPEDTDFSIPIGEVRSRGIEFDIGGKILPGWNIVASAYLNESIVTVGDEFSPEGDTLAFTPRQGASLWTTYQIQKGSAKGFGFGAGLFYVADRQTYIPNQGGIILPSYVRADASLFYKRNDWSVQLNFKNLFSTHYFDSSEYSFGTVPGAPFSVQGTISVRF
ncbi:TonB-dependent siderophore receptor [Nostoc sp.]|uniref:TonB-dependent siderophore receptor n=1 Tax=Nostoc sp. TaxID=1180 RepID=UPI002FFA2407